MSKTTTVISVFLGFVALAALAEPYEVERIPDGSFSFKLLGVEMNRGSTLRRESILFNEPTCPVRLINNRMSFSYVDSRININSTTELSLKQSAVALEVRYILFDVFGLHMKNLSNLEVQDLATGPNSLAATWTLFNDNDSSRFLTSVTYVSRVRLADGTQWIADEKNLSQALEAICLERKIENENTTQDNS